MQTKKQSFIEANSQAIVGSIIGLIVIRILLPLIEHLDKNTQTIIIVFIMFIASTSRGYVMRRFFEKLTKKQNKTIDIK